MSEQQRTIPMWNRPGWSLLFSLKVGLGLLFLLTVASIYGTLIKDLTRAQQVVYYSWWYKYLLLLPMAVNMLCATFKTIVEKIMPIARPRFMRQPQFYAAAPNRAEIPYTGDAATAAAAFRRRGFKTFTEDAFGYAHKGWLSRWGAPIAHCGMIIVLLGGFGSAWFSKEGGLWLLEGGEATTKMSLINDSKQELPLGFSLRCEDFQTGFYPRTRIISKFTSVVSYKEPGEDWHTAAVEVNNSLHIAGWNLHQSSYQPYDQWERYQLAVHGPGNPTTATLEISPGQRRAIPGLAGSELELTTNYPITWTVLQQGKAAASGLMAQPATGDWVIRADQFEPDFVITTGAPGSRSQNLNNPALKVTMLQNGKELYTQWLFGKAEMKEMMKNAMHQKGGPYTPELVNVDGQAPNWVCQVVLRDGTGALVGDYQLAAGQQVRLQSPAATKPPPAAAGAGEWRVRLAERVQPYATYLTLTRNPMIPVIYGGCAVMLLGLLAVFFVRPRQVWFRVDPASRRLQVAAIYRHPQAELDGATRAVLERLK